MKYYYSENKIKGMVAARQVKGRLFDSPQQAAEYGRKIKGNNENIPAGYICVLQQVENTGENINHRYKSSLPFVVVGCEPAAKFYTK